MIRMHKFWQASLTRNVILTLAGTMFAFWLLSEAISFYYRYQKAEAEVRDDLTWELRRVSQEEHRLYELAQIRVNTLLRLWSELLSGARLSQTPREPSRTVFMPFAGATLDDDAVAAVGQVLEVFGNADPQSPVTTFLKIPGQGLLFYRPDRPGGEAANNAQQSVIRQRFGVLFEEPLLNTHSLSRSVVTAVDPDSAVMAGQALNINRMGEHRPEFSYLLRDDAGTVFWSDLGVGAEASALQALVPGCRAQVAVFDDFIVACTVLEDTHLQMLAVAPRDLAMKQVLSILVSTAPWALLAQITLLLLLALILHRRLGRPLRHIVAIIHRQQRSTDLSFRLPEGRKDELGRIARAYNSLLTNLNAYHQTLEDKVSERTRELSVAKRMAENANDRKSEHLTSVSHEIRTPLNGIVGALSLLERGALPGGQQQELIATALQSSGFLLSIINNLLDFSRIEAGQLQLSCEQTDLLMLLDQALLTVNLRAQEKHLQLQVLVMADVPPLMRLDGIRVQQILVNLLANAVKFTSSGGVYVRVARQDEMLVISVQDTGRGISTAQQQDIFKPFSQVRVHDTGSGLGLAIALQLARLMGGEIELLSEVGKGSVFTLRLPIIEPSPITPLTMAHFTAPASLHSQLSLWGVTAEVGECPVLDMPELVYLPGRLRQKISSLLKASIPQEEPAWLAPSPWSLKVLIVDDIAINRDIVGKMLAVLGHQVYSAIGGQQALKLGREHVFDLVLMDVRMPDMDGFEVTAFWRDESSGMLDSETLIWALTANALPAEWERAKAAGMNGYLAKPVSLEQLATAVGQAISLLLARGIDLAPNSILQQPLLDLNDAVSHQKLHAALQELYENLVIAHRQVERQTVLEWLHALKGCAGQAGLDLLYELVREHEIQIEQGAWPSDQDMQGLRGLIRQSALGS
ncbi:two component system sensor kinase [Pseudomonas zeae]|uniref:two component system sensor kinase n=1 Tax=Pseudomonas zeae TaxID=2745510 RepID=UPI0039E08812